jgi:DNA invertase Pin-like site-specific DNA recombinase
MANPSLIFRKGTEGRGKAMSHQRKSRKKLIQAVAYYRTSSATNVGDDKDSLERQRVAVSAFAKRHGYQVGEEFYDPAVSGADAIEDRPGFTALLDLIEGNGVRTVIVEDVSRFAREMKAHVLGIALLRERGVRLLSAVDGQNLTEETDEMTEGMVTIMAVFAQIEKKRLVKKLRAARDRKSAKLGRRIEGRKSSYAERKPELVKLAKRLAHANRKQKLSLRAIAAKLAEAGFVTATGKPFSADQVNRLLHT